MTWRRSFRPYAIPRGPGTRDQGLSRIVREGTKVCLAFGVLGLARMMRTDRWELVDLTLKFGRDLRYMPAVLGGCLGCLECSIALPYQARQSGLAPLVAWSV